MIVEYAGNGPYQNQFGDISTGHPEGSKMGYGITGGRGFIWVCIPYLNTDGTRNVTQWWGDKPKNDPQPTLAYCKRSSHGFAGNTAGTPGAWCSVVFPAPLPVIIWACTMTKSPLWRAFIPYSHYDGVRRWGYPGSDKAAASKRLQRLGARPNSSATKARVFRPRNSI